MLRIMLLSVCICVVLSAFPSNLLAADATMPGYSSTYPDRAHCRISMARVNDPDPPLNVRSSPTVLPDNIVGKIDQGKWLVVEEEKDGWFKIAPFMGTSKEGGWVAKNRTLYSCSFYRETITTTPVTLKDFFIGMGSHEYMISLEKGQTLIMVVGQTNSGLSGERISSWPFFMDGAGKKDIPDSPNGYTDKVKGMSPDGTQWTWIVTETGTYRISYESNFKGFDYNLTIDVR